MTDVTDVNSLELRQCQISHSNKPEHKYIQIQKLKLLPQLIWPIANQVHWCPNM